MRRGPLVIVVALLAAAGIALARGAVPCEVLAAQPSCEVALAPGPSQDTLELISIDGQPTHRPDTGALQMTTVAVREDLTLPGWWDAHRSPTVEVVPREQVFPAEVDRDEVDEFNAAAMRDSQLVATIVALESLGHELHGEGALVAAIADDVVTDRLEVGDLIVAVDGRSVSESTEAVEVVQAASPGDVVSFTVQRDGSEQTVRVELGRSSEDPQVGYVGVLLTTELDLPIDVEVETGAVGGPSAGLVFALSIVELLEPDDLLDGRVVAGTGALRRDGTVAGVGGVPQKLAAASAPDADAGRAEVFLVPRENLAEARAATVGSDLLLVPVETFGEAIDALRALRTGREPDEAVLLAADR